MRVSSTPHSIALSGAAVSAITLPYGSSTLCSFIHCKADSALSIVSLVVKVLDATTSNVAAGSKSLIASSSATPSTLDTIATS